MGKDLSEMALKDLWQFFFIRNRKYHLFKNTLSLQNKS